MVLLIFLTQPRLIFKTHHPITKLLCPSQSSSIRNCSISLTTDACLTAESGVSSSIQARSYTFVEIGYEKNSMIILIPFSESFKKGYCQLQSKICARSNG